MRPRSVAEILAPLRSAGLFAISAVQAWAAPEFAEWEARARDADDSGAADFTLASTLWI